MGSVVLNGATSGSTTLTPTDAVTVSLTLPSSSGALAILPPGMVANFAMNTAPTGWLAADGSAISRTTYAALFAAIGTTFGAGNGTTTFNLPNLGGQFTRNWISGQTTDSGRTFGSTQTDDFKSHTHTINDPGHSHTCYSVAGSGSGIAAGAGDSLVAVGTSVSTTGITNNSTGGTETRPTNVALLACIKT